MSSSGNSAGTKVIISVLLGLLLASVSHAIPLNLAAADKALKAEKWAEAETEYERVMDPYQTRCGSSIVARFGPVYFKKGWCELKQQKWKEAMASFEACYKKYPSTQNFQNPYHKKSLRYWAEAAYGAGEHQESAKIYRKYLVENPKK